MVIDVIRGFVFNFQSVTLPNLSFFLNNKSKEQYKRRFNVLQQVRASLYSRWRHVLEEITPPPNLVRPAHLVRPAEEDTSSLAHPLPPFSLSLLTCSLHAMAPTVEIENQRQTRQAGGSNWFQGVAYKFPGQREQE